METPIQMDDLGVPFFLETPICTINLKSCDFFCCSFFAIDPGWHDGFSLTTAVTRKLARSEVLQYLLRMAVSHAGSEAIKT